MCATIMDMDSLFSTLSHNIQDWLVIKIQTKYKAIFMMRGKSLPSENIEITSRYGVDFRDIKN